MVSIRRRKLLGLCSGSSSSFQLPKFSNNGIVSRNPIQSKSVSVHPMPSLDLSQPKEIDTSNLCTGSSNMSDSSSSKEQNLPFSGQEIKRRKRRRRKHFEGQEPCVFRGVYFKNNRWQAAIKVDKKQIHLGTVGSQEEAAHLYDRAAFMCGREPNFELSEEEKEELRRYKWDEFVTMARSSISNKKPQKRVEQGPIMKPGRTAVGSNNQDIEQGASAALGLQMDKRNLADYVVEEPGNVKRVCMTTRMTEVSMVNAITDAARKDGMDAPTTSNKKGDKMVVSGNRVVEGMMSSDPLLVKHSANEPKECSESPAAKSLLVLRSSVTLDTQNGLVGVTRLSSSTTSCGAKEVVKGLGEGQATILDSRDEVAEADLPHTERALLESSTPTMPNIQTGLAGVTVYPTTHSCRDETMNGGVVDGQDATLEYMQEVVEGDDIHRQFPSLESGASIMPSIHTGLGGVTTHPTSTSGGDETTGEGSSDGQGTNLESREEVVEDDKPSMDGNDKCTRRGKGKVGGRGGGMRNKCKKFIPAYAEMGVLGGGPKIESVLRSFREHVAHAIWVGHDTTKVMKLQYHTRKFKQWNFSKESSRFKTLYLSSGISELSRVAFSVVDNALATTLIERWQPETNTFHLPFGEMTITLDDVKQILDVPVTGKPVVGVDSFSTTAARALLVSALGVTEQEARKVLKGGTVVPHHWLQDRFSGTMEHDPVTQSGGSSYEEVEAAVKAYHLFVLGCTALTDKSGTSISVQYLQFLKDLADIPKYNWGSAVLAYLYRQLSIGCKAETKQMGGCHTLLQVWIHEHLNFGNPLQSSAYDEKRPRAYKWLARQTSGDKEVVLITQREALDDINRSQVVWDPYSCSRAHHPFPEISYFKGWLLCLDIVEAYHPDRVLRQLGRYQSIPDLPVPLSIKSDTNLLGGYLHNWEDHCLSMDKRGVPILHGWDADDSYDEWYGSITHRFVQNPIYRMKPAISHDRNDDLMDVDLVKLLEKGISLCRRVPCHPNMEHVLTNAAIKARKILENYREYNLLIARLSLGATHNVKKSDHSVEDKDASNVRLVGDEMDVDKLDEATEEEPTVRRRGKRFRGSIAKSTEAVDAQPVKSTVKTSKCGKGQDTVKATHATKTMKTTKDAKSARTTKTAEGTKATTYEQSKVKEVESSPRLKK